MSFSLSSRYPLYCFTSSIPRDEGFTFLARISYEPSTLESASLPALSAAQSLLTSEPRTTWSHSVSGLLLAALGLRPIAASLKAATASGASSETSSQSAWAWLPAPVMASWTDSHMLAGWALPPPRTTWSRAAADEAAPRRRAEVPSLMMTVVFWIGLSLTIRSL